MTLRRSIASGWLAGMVAAGLDALALAVWGRGSSPLLLSILAGFLFTENALLPFGAGLLAARPGGPWWRRALFGALAGLASGLTLVLLLLIAASVLGGATDRSRFWQDAGFTLATYGALAYAIALPLFTVIGGVAASLR